jgi:hypothetical protein
MMDNRLRELGFSSYDEYLRSDLWMRNRKRIRGPRRCWACGTTVGLDVHHRTYCRLGNESGYHLMYLCREHHSGLHVFVRQHGLKLWGAHIKYRSYLGLKAPKVSDEERARRRERAKRRRRERKTRAASSGG